MRNQISTFVGKLRRRETLCNQFGAVVKHRRGAFNKGPWESFAKFRIPHLPRIMQTPPMPPIDVLAPFTEISFT